MVVIEGPQAQGFHTEGTKAMNPMTATAATESTTPEKTKMKLIVDPPQSERAAPLPPRYTSISHSHRVQTGT